MLDKPSPRLPLNTVEEMFDKLKWEEDRLRDGYSLYDLWNFIVTAHHLYWDWICQGKAANAEQKARADALPDDAQTVFQAVIDVSNGSKHWSLEHPGSKKRQIITEVTPLICAGYDSYFFGDMVHFRFGEYFVSMSEIAALVMKYFEWVIYGGDSSPVAELSAAFEGMKLSSSADEE